VNFNLIDEVATDQSDNFRAVASRLSPKRLLMQLGDEADRHREGGA
jgi:hypothetical protein